MKAERAPGASPRNLANKPSYQACGYWKNLKTSPSLEMFARARAAAAASRSRRASSKEESRATSAADDGPSASIAFTTARKGAVFASASTAICGG